MAEIPSGFDPDSAAVTPGEIITYFVEHSGKYVEPVSTPAIEHEFNPLEVEIDFGSIIYTIVEEVNHKGSSNTRVINRKKPFIVLETKRRDGSLTIVELGMDKDGNIVFNLLGIGTINIREIGECIGKATDDEIDAWATFGYKKIPYVEELLNKFRKKSQKKGPRRITIYPQDKFIE